MDLIIRNARLSTRPADPPVDIGIERGRIAAIAPALPAEGREFDAAGGLVCAGLIETHIHLDKSRIIERCPPEEGRDVNPVKSVAPLKPTFTVEDTYKRAAHTLEECILHGATRMRTQVEVDPGIGLRGYEALGRHGRELRHVAGDDAAAAPVFFREIAHLMDVEVIGGGADVEMHVDVDVELAPELEDALDLRRPVGIVARRAADHLSAALEPLDHQLVGAGIIGQPFLREHADFEVDRPFVFIDQRGYGLEAAHADARVDLDLRAHAGRPVQDAFFQRVGGARVDVLDRPGLLHRRDALDRIDLARLLGRASLDDARLIEMDVGLDQSAAAEASLGIVGGRL